MLKAILIFILEITLCFLIIIPKRYFRNFLAYGFLFIILVQILSFIEIEQFIPLLALSNIDQFKNLDLMPYVLFFSIFLLLIILSLKFHSKNLKTSNIALILIFVSIFALNNRSPIYAFFKTLYFIPNELALRHRLNEDQKIEIIKKLSKEKIVYDSNISSYITPKKYNVILFLVESLSSAPITKELMPNTYNFLSNSINIKNYYNHTAATLRGIRGDLYSFFQLSGGTHRIQANLITSKANMKNFFKNSSNKRLISLIDILRANGYHSYFQIADTTKEFIEYFKNSLGFDNFITFENLKNKKAFYNYALSDEFSFKFLQENLNTLKEPFFYAFYTFQTHINSDSKIKYKDGKKRDLNKFHNFDYYFGLFLKWFNNSNLKDNTIIILTGDHAHFPGGSYKRAFKNSSKMYIDKIAFGIYKFNSPAAIIDAKGLNSLSLAPTICDILGIKEAKNTFLGRSIFERNHTLINKIGSVNAFDFYKSDENGVKRIDKDDKKFKKVLDKIVDYKVIGG